MSWTSAVTSIPHVYEAIFGHLNELRDRLIAVTVCPQWEAAMFGSRKLTENIALRVLGPVGRRQRLISVRDVALSNRRYESVIVAPSGEPNLIWEDLITVLAVLNHKCPIRWARITGTYEEQIITPPAMIHFGNVLGSLQQLELTLTFNSFWDPAWPRAFKYFPHLRSLTMHDGHGRALESVRNHCPGLTKLVLKRFALTKPLGELLDFPDLEELVIDELDVSPQNLELRCAPSQLVLSRLKHLTILISVKVALRYLVMLPVTIVAPSLQSTRVTDLLHRFVRIEAGNELKTFTLNIAALTPRHFVSPRIVRSSLVAIATVTIESDFLRPFVIQALAWVKQCCPNARRLIFDQALDASALKRVREFAGREMPGLKEIVTNSNEFRNRYFALEFEFLEQAELVIHNGNVCAIAVN